MSAFTAKTWTIDRAPKRIAMLGEKTKRPEPAQHVIEFPGGAVEVSRTMDGSYWCHIVINHRQGAGDGDGLSSALGEVVGSRLDVGQGPEDIPSEATLTQVAVLVRPRK